MRIIISPAKKMREDTDSLPYKALPVFLQKTGLLMERLRELSYEELKKLWKCNDKIAEQNVQRLRYMDLEGKLTPAVLAYDGIQYQYMAPSVFSYAEFDYMQERLRILSGFYGVLRPFDGVTPYRLEMQAKLAVADCKDLYGFWGSDIANLLASETNCIINLASKEYSVCVSKYLPKSVRFITCVFGELVDGKVIEKGTMCKMARGEMVRFMAEGCITDPEGIQGFDRLGYRYSASHSNEDTYVFLKEKEESPYD